jgi:hypothetical protein
MHDGVNGPWTHPRLTPRDDLNKYHRANRRAPDTHSVRVEKSICALSWTVEMYREWP